MKNKKTLLLKALPIIAFTLSASMATNNAFAAESEAGNKSAKKSSYRTSKKVPAMRNRVYAQLARAQKLADEGDKIEGFEVLNDVEDRIDSLNSYERAMLFNFYGFMYYANDDVEIATDYFMQVIDEIAIPDSLTLSTLYSLAQLSMQQQNYTEALNYLTEWRSINQKELTSNQEMLFAQVYYQDKDYKSALKHIDAAIVLAGADNKQPKENWLTLQRASYYELKQPEQVTKVIETLVRLYPKPQYWLQLSAMYGEIGEEAKQMAVMETAYQAGYVTKSTDIITLSQLYLFHGAPYKSADVLERAIEMGNVFADENNLNMLASAYLTAKEEDKAIQVLTRLSDIAPSGKHDALLAQTYLNTEQWPSAISAAKVALSRYAEHKGSKGEKGNKSDKNEKAASEKDIANMHLILGMANFNLQKFDASLLAFNNAAKFSTTKKTALQWGKYVEREKTHYEVKLAMLN